MTVDQDTPIDPKTIEIDDWVTLKHVEGQSVTSKVIAIEQHQDGADLRLMNLGWFVVGHSWTVASKEAKCSITFSHTRHWCGNPRCRDS